MLYHAASLASDAYEQCGPGMSRDEFGIFAWCHPALEAAAWDIYSTMKLH